MHKYVGAFCIMPLIHCQNVISSINFRLNHNAHFLGFNATNYVIKWQMQEKIQKYKPKHKFSQTLQIGKIGFISSWLVAKRQDGIVSSILSRGPF